MDYETFKKCLKKEFKGDRIISPIELLQFEIIAQNNKLDFECILLAVQFAKLIKGACVHINYIKAIIEQWIGQGLLTPAAIRSHLRTKSSSLQNKKHKIKEYHTKEFYTSLFDNVEQVVL